MKMDWKTPIHIFRVDDTLTSHKFPITKIVVCVALVLFFVNRNHFFVVENTGLNILNSVVCFCVAMASLFCIVLSLAEIIMIQDNRTPAKKASASGTEKCKKYSIEEITSMADNNDIIEIRIVADGKTVGRFQFRLQGGQLNVF